MQSNYWMEEALLSEAFLHHSISMAWAQTRTCSSEIMNLQKKTRMWANAQRRPAECRWRPLFNATKFGWCPLPECHAVILPRCETGWNLLGCPKVANRSQLLVGRSSPYCEDTWGMLLFNTLFPIVVACLICKDIAQQSCAVVRRWRCFASCISSEPRAAHFRQAF